MDFEIILSTYNGEDFLEEQIDSIIKQKHENWNLKIFDDCSTDKTIDILKYYSNIDSRIEYKINDEKLGPTFSFYNLLKNSKKDFIVFCDQDDIWSDKKLHEIKKFIISTKEPFIMGVHNGEFLIKQKNKVIFNKQFVLNKDLIYEKQPNLSFFNLLKSNKIIGCFSFIKRNEFIKILKVKPPKDQGIFLDYWIALVASSQSKIAFLDKNLISYRRHENVATISERKVLSKFKTRFVLIIFLLYNFIKYYLNKKLF